MLTSKEKPKVFALYYGAPYRYIPAGEKEPVVESVDGKTIKFVEYGIHTGNPQLLLKPLSEISDEDAVQVAKLTETHYTDMGDMIITGNRIVKNIESVPITEPFLENYINITDFLRSRSYMLPYKGINLFESGIAIKEKK